jgi:polyphenol oxidase
MNLTPLTSAPVLPRSTTNGLPTPSDSFEWRQAPWGDVLVCRALEGVATHFFTGRELQLRNGSERGRADWAQVAAALGLPAERLWRMRQVHGCDVFSVGGDEAVASIETHGDSPAEHDRRPKADAMITDRSDVALAVQVADCVPLLLADPRTGAISATHAGWRSTSANIASHSIARLAREYGVRPADVIAAIGPSISPACFQVGPDVREEFLNSEKTAPLGPAKWFTPDVDDRLRLDIWQANHDQLVASGLRSENIHIAGLCTMTHVRHFFSYRLEQQGTGRMVGVIRRLAS